MMFPTKDIGDLKDLNELASLQNQVQEVRLQDKLGKQNFHEDMKKVFEPVNKTLKDVSEELTRTITDSSKNNNKALENLNNKLLELMNDRIVLATSLMSSSSTLTNPENTTQFKIVKYSSSNRVNDLLIRNTIPNTLFYSLLTFRDTGKEFELKGDLLKMITNQSIMLVLLVYRIKK